MKIIPFPKKKYNIIYADPPWKYQDSSCNGGQAYHYRGMKLEDICRLPVQNIADKDCVLFMWVTYPFLAKGLQVITSWGFKYRSIGFQWIKLNRSGKGKFFGLGRWTRGNTEPCLLGVCEKPSRISASVSQLVESPVGRHSQKPAIVRDKIVELMGDLPKIELFARGMKGMLKGLDVWGDEAEG